MDNEGSADVRAGGTYLPAGTGALIGGDRLTLDESSHESGWRPEHTAAVAATETTRQAAIERLNQVAEREHGGKDAMVSTRYLLMKRIDAARHHAHVHHESERLRHQESSELQALLDVLPSNLDAVSPLAARGLARLLRQSPI